MEAADREESPAPAAATAAATASAAAAARVRKRKAPRALDAAATAAESAEPAVASTAVEELRREHESAELENDNDHGNGPELENGRENDDDDDDDDGSVNDADDGDGSVNVDDNENENENEIDGGAKPRAVSVAVVVATSQQPDTAPAAMARVAGTPTATPVAVVAAAAASTSTGDAVGGADAVGEVASDAIGSSNNAGEGEGEGDPIVAVTAVPVGRQPTAATATAGSAGAIPARKRRRRGGGGEEGGGEGASGAETDSTQAGTQPKAPERSRAQRQAYLMSERYVQHQASFNRMYNLLVEFKEQFGHCSPTRYTPETKGPHAPFPNLGQWVSRMREAKRNAELLARGLPAPSDKRIEPENIQRLTDLGFMWDRAHQRKWRENFNAFLDFKAFHGHCFLRSVKRQKLGRWAASQRERRAALRAGRVLKNRTRAISQAEIDELTEAGFIWDNAKYIWDRSFEELQRFHKENGHLKVPKDLKTIEGFVIDRWCARQRRLRRQGKLSDDRIALLDELEFAWEATDFQWIEHYAELKKFHSVAGHCDVPASLPGPQGRGNMLEWCVAQRSERQKGTLPPRRVQQLTALGFPWDESETADEAARNNSIHGASETQAT